MPARDVAGRRVARDVIHAHVQRIEAGGRVVALGIARLRGAEAGAGVGVADAQRLVDGLGDVETDHVRAVERQQVLAAEPVEVDVAEPVAGAHHGLVVHRPRGAEARREVVAIRVHQRAVVDRAVLRADQRVGRRIEVGEEVVLLVLRRAVLVAQAGVERHVRADLDVVLEVAEVHPLAEVGEKRRDDRVRAAQAEHEVREVVGRRIRGGAGGSRELPAVAVAAVLRVEIVDLRVDRLVLVAGLEALAAPDPRVVDARVEDRRILELGIAVLAAPGRPARDPLLRQPAGEALVGRAARKCRRPRACSARPRPGAPCPLRCATSRCGTRAASSSSANT